MIPIQTNAELQSKPYQKTDFWYANDFNGLSFLYFFDVSTSYQMETFLFVTKPLE